MSVFRFSLRILLMAITAIVAVIAAPAPAVAAQTVYRFYNTRAGTHFFTADGEESQRVRDSLDTVFTYEGPAYQVPSTGDPGTENAIVPVYRFYNLRNGSHFYTTSDSERDRVLRELTSVYEFEGTAYHVLGVQIAGTLPVHRFYNVRNGSHFYTANDEERRSVESSLASTYTYEGVAFYVGTPPAPEPEPVPSPTNIIIMIGDGMGYGAMLTGDYYLYGEAGRSFEGMSFASAMSTYPFHGSYSSALAWSDFEWVKGSFTDSAAAATAMSTGVKTRSGRIGMDPYDVPVRNIVEAAEAAGLSTGVVSSMAVSHATPAGFVAHNSRREDYPGIAREMVSTSTVDVIMGAGNPCYDNDGVLRTTPDYTYVGEATWSSLLAGAPQADANGDGIRDPWTLVQSRQDIVGLGSGPTPARVCAIPRVFSTLQEARNGDVAAAPFARQFTPGIPTLSELSAAALNVLDADPDGFVLLIEGGAIDQAAHNGYTSLLIEEQVDFVTAVRQVDAWVQANSSWEDTLLIVTADHETGYLSGPGSGTVEGKALWCPILNNGKGVVPGMQWNSADHTNSLVPFYAKGADATRFAPLVDGSDTQHGSYIDNTDIAAVCFGLVEERE